MKKKMIKCRRCGEVKHRSEFVEGHLICIDCEISPVENTTEILKIKSDIAAIEKKLEQISKDIANNKATLEDYRQAQREYSGLVYHLHFTTQGKKNIGYESRYIKNI